VFTVKGRYDMTISHIFQLYFVKIVLITYGHTFFFATVSFQHDICVKI
jgi:hypothetical protein